MDRTKIKVRLVEPYAPESGPRQSLVMTAKEHLAELVFEKTVRVEPHYQGRYGLTIGDIIVNAK